MIKLNLMASHGCPNPSQLVLHPEQNITRMIKEFPPYIKEARQDGVYSGICNLRPNDYQGQWKPIAIVHGANEPQKIGSTVEKPLVIDMKDACSNSILLSRGIAEKCARQENLMQLVTSRASEVETGRLNLSSLSNLLELQPLLFDVHQKEFASSLIFPSIRLIVDDEKPLLDLFGASHSKFTFDPDGRVLVPGNGTEMRDILSIVAEYYLSKNSSKSSKEHMLVPYFYRSKSRKIQAALRLSSYKLDAEAVAPTKSPEKTKTKPSTKKKNPRNIDKDRNLYYKRNFFHACESLLSVMMNKRQHGKMAILSIQKSGAELPALLNQFSAGIAGTGLAVVLSIVCKVGSGKAPFCSSKLFTAGLGFGLVWLSWAVNRLRDTVVYIRKNSGKLNSEEEMISRVDESVNQIYFRAATLTAVAMLKLV